MHPGEAFERARLINAVVTEMGFVDSNPTMAQGTN